MASLDKYGKKLREYEGVGLLTLSDGQTCGCSVHAIQIADGNILASCDFNDNFDVVSSCYNNDARIKLIKATTRDNSEFLIEGNILSTGFNHSWKPNESRIEMVISAGSLECEKQSSDVLTSARFGITNFEFFGNKVTPYPKGGGARDILAVNLGDITIEIHEIPDHKSIMDFVKAQKGIDVTSEAVIAMSSTKDLDKAIEYIDVLCKLLSFARGTKINWIYCDCYNNSKERILTFHKNSVAWQYTALPVIDYRNPNDTANFIKQVYPFTSQRKMIMVWT